MAVPFLKTNIKQELFPCPQTVANSDINSIAIVIFCLFCVLSSVTNFVLAQ
ncbi:hypothetical protein N478_08300 [Pseudoalteromonas luteoviolacea S4060-1]|uniref:Uncharacterized protein n=1 Tax=Pseudoalteromonas luteoviolacea S4060-1 TaxID=1365257 RepID=A0A167IM68_9GAMM|nr:hypothetical protein N478_08300 [Pseudoalteromonas luteoviolacea S4060-1]